MFYVLFVVRTCVIDLSILSESSEGVKSGIKVSRFVEISGEMQFRVSFGGKYPTFVYLDLFSLTSFRSCILVLWRICLKSINHSEDHEYSPI